jgi:hypothetical protein
MYSVIIPVVFSILFFISAVGFGIAAYKCKSDGFVALTIVFLIAHFFCLIGSIVNAKELEKGAAEYERKIEAFKHIIESLKKDGYKEPKE